MSQQILDLGDTPNDAEGDPLREGGEKINTNFSELYAAVQALNDALATLDQNDIAGLIDALSAKLNKSGDTMGGIMNMGSNRIEALGAPDSADDATNKGYVDGAIGTATGPKAPTDSPAFTGTPTAPTASVSVNTTQLATTAFVKAVVAQLVNAAPGQLDQLNELAAALGNDANYSATVTAALSQKATTAQGVKADSALQPGTAISNIAGLVSALAALAPLVSPTFTGTPVAPTAAQGTNTTQIANTAFVQAAVAALVNASPAQLDTLNELAAALGNDANYASTTTAALAAKAPLASPAFTGAPTAPTPAKGNVSTQIATTEFVQALGAGLGTVGTTQPIDAILGWQTLTTDPAGYFLNGTRDASFAKEYPADPDAYAHFMFGGDVTSMQALGSLKRLSFQTLLPTFGADYVIGQAVVGSGLVSDLADSATFTNIISFIWPDQTAAGQNVVLCGTQQTASSPGSSVVLWFGTVNGGATTRRLIRLRTNGRPEIILPVPDNIVAGDTVVIAHESDMGKATGNMERLIIASENVAPVPHELHANDAFVRAVSVNPHTLGLGYNTSTTYATQVRNLQWRIYSSAIGVKAMLRKIAEMLAVAPQRRFVSPTPTQGPHFVSDTGDGSGSLKWFPAVRNNIQAAYHFLNDSETSVQSYRNKVTGVQGLPQGTGAAAVLKATGGLLINPAGAEGRFRILTATETDDTAGLTLLLAANITGQTLLADLGGAKVSLDTGGTRMRVDSTGGNGLGPTLALGRRLFLLEVSAAGTFLGTIAADGTISGTLIPAATTRGALASLGGIYSGGTAETAMQAAVVYKGVPTNAEIVKAAAQIRAYCQTKGQPLL